MTQFRRRTSVRIALALAAFGVSLPVRGVQTQPTVTEPPSTTAPTTSTAPAEGMTAVVEEVTGNVRVRKDKDSPWVPATVGMELREGSEIRTGIRSAIRCGIPPDQTFTLDRLGTIELSQAVKQGNLVKTDLTMKYGRAQYRIEKAGLDHDASISSPGSTLAVRGTTVELEDTPPFKPRAISYTGRARFTAANRTTAVGSPGGTKATLDAGAVNAANVALIASVVDPQFKGGRTESDKRLIAQQVSLGATARFDEKTQIQVVTGGPGPNRSESDLVTQLPGRLNFVARWTNDVDVNLQVAVSKGDPGKTLLNPEKPGQFNFNEYIYPGFGLNSSPSGGKIDFDHRGGANGGQEIVYWKGTFPVASYGVGLALVSNKATDVTLNAFLDGKKLPLFAGALPGTGPTYTPALKEESFDLGDGNIFTFLRGKSTTFTVHLEPTTGSNVAGLNVYIPLSPDLPLGQEEDLNNGASADIPVAGTGTPDNSALRTAKLTPASPPASRGKEKNRTTAVKTEKSDRAKNRGVPTLKPGQTTFIRGAQ